VETLLLFPFLILPKRGRCSGSSLLLFGPVHDDADQRQLSLLPGLSSRAGPTFLFQQEPTESRSILLRPCKWPAPRCSPFSLAGLIISPASPGPGHVGQLGLHQSLSFSPFAADRATFFPPLLGIPPFSPFFPTSPPPPSNDTRAHATVSLCTKDAFPFTYTRRVRFPVHMKDIFAAPLSLPPELFEARPRSTFLHTRSTEAFFFPPHAAASPQTSAR